MQAAVVIRLDKHFLHTVLSNELSESVVFLTFNYYTTHS